MSKIESRLQSDIREFLKSRGCYVLVIKPQPGIPDGCPDVIFMRGRFWGSIEVKDSPTAKYQPLQEETIELHNGMSWSRRVDPTNWLETKIELEFIL